MIDRFGKKHEVAPVAIVVETGESVLTGAPLKTSENPS
jgi:hypothetical protein